MKKLIIALLSLLVMLFVYIGCQELPEDEGLHTNPLDPDSPNSPPSQPSEPSPENGANNVTTSTTITWICSDEDQDQLTYDVYFGSTNPPSLVQENTSSQLYQPQGLMQSTTYFWKIVAKDGNNDDVEGPVWTFTTSGAGNQPPDQPSSPVPENESEGISVNPALSWSCSDPEEDALFYDVHLGTTSPPPLVSENQSENLYTPVNALDFSTNYYWKIVAKDDAGKVVDKEIVIDPDSEVAVKKSKNRNIQQTQGSTHGPLWSFTTIAEGDNQPPGNPHDPVPDNQAIDVPVNTTLQWACEDPESDALVYDVLFGDDPGALQLVSENQSANSYDPAGELLEGTNYFWKIIAKDSNENSTEGQLWRFRTAGQGNLPPNDPTNPFPSDDADNVYGEDLTLTWNCTDPDGDDMTFNVFMGTTTESMVVIASDLDDEEYLLPNTLNYNQQYFWRVQAVDVNENSNMGPIWMFTTEGENLAPDAPSNPNPSNMATDVSLLNLTISWDCSDPDMDPLTYDVLFGSDPDHLQQVATGISESQFNIDFTLSPVTNYYWKIVAHDDRDNETEGPRWTFRTGSSGNQPPDVPYFPVPENGATNVSAPNVQLSWECQDPEQDHITYDVFFGQTAGGMSLVHDDINTRECNVNAAIYGLTYYWKVIAEDEHGNSTEGPTWSFTTTEAVDQVIFIDFELDAVGELPWGRNGYWWNYSIAGGDFNATDAVVYEGNRSLHIGSPYDDTNWIEANHDAQTHARLEMMMYFPLGGNLLVQGSSDVNEYNGGARAFRVEFLPGGGIEAWNGFNRENIAAAYPLNEWFMLAIEYNFATHTYDVYLNNNQIASDFQFENGNEGTNCPAFNFYTYNLMVVEDAFIDNVRLLNLSN